LGHAAVFGAAGPSTVIAANGSLERAADDRLREAIDRAATENAGLLGSSPLAR
jgi:hypothetical protein